MTNRERLIVSAYTGILMCDLGELQEYIEELLGRPVVTHELADKAVWAEIKEKCKKEFLALCDTGNACPGCSVSHHEPDVVERKRGEWKVAQKGFVASIFACSECGREVEITNPYFGKPTTHAAASYPFCHCGADMRGPAHGSAQV